MVEEVQSQPECSTKRIRFEEIREEVKDEDQISRLPDCLLVDILSRLPATKYAVRTAAISKRWKHIWTSVPTLIFSDEGNLTVDYVSFVDKTLIKRGQLKLKTLEVYGNYNDRFESHVHNWIRYAVNCNVEELNITFWKMERGSEFLLDEFISINSRVTNLSLWRCVFNSSGTISWIKLRRLHISRARLDEDLIENILSGSPVLETLMLQGCYGFKKLNITSKSVKNLMFLDYLGPANIFIEEFKNVLEINAPNILTLAITDNMFLWKLLLVDVSSLVEAELDYWKGGHYEAKTREEDEEEMLKGFILNLRHVKELKIGVMYCAKILFRLEAKGFIRPSNLKVCGDVSFYPLDSDDDSVELSESGYSEVLLHDDGITGDDVLQEPVDAKTSSNRENDD